MSIGQVTEILNQAEILRNVMWTMAAALLVFFMQAGFAAVETGFSRAKNAGSTINKNLVLFVISSLFFNLIGFGLMFGADAGGFVGTSGIFNTDAVAQNGMVGGLPLGVFLIYNTVLAAIVCTVVSGALAERTKFSAYIVFGACISVFIYPVVGHWIWGGGLLASRGFHDFAGATVIHSVGGWCALIGAKIVGPRIGKYSKEGKSKAIPGHNIPLSTLGVFILWFCWFGFNLGATKAVTMNVGDIAMTTNLAAVASTIVTILLSWFKYRKIDIPMTLNGTLAGLVAITAGCDIVSYQSAFVIGAIAGVLVVFSVEFIDKVMKIDDPVGVTSVHWICGIAGTFLTGVFAKSSVLTQYGISRTAFINTQLFGIVAVGLYTTMMAYVIFTVIKKIIGIRVADKVEIEGIDIYENGINAYPDFNKKVY